MIIIGSVAIIGLFFLPLIDFLPYHVGAKIKTQSDFYITDLHGKDITESILTDTSYVFLIVSPQLETADIGVMDEMNHLYDFITEKNYHIYGITSFSSQAIEEWRYLTGAAYPFFYAEETLLQEIVRANPGILLLKNGKILGKWSNKNFPQPSFEENDWFTKLTPDPLHSHPYLVIMIMLLGYILPLFTMRHKNTVILL